MVKYISVAILCFTVSISLGQTQYEMNQDAYKDFQKNDKELNTVYKKILEEYKSDTMFIKNLKIAQNIWVQLRDAEMKAKFPEEDGVSYGSVESMCWNMYKTQLTSERTKTLKLWLIGSDEGDVCSGSVKAKPLKIK
jgi:uncharacterized protein YecT (DUF1311 family)